MKKLLLVVAILVVMLGLFGGCYSSPTGSNTPPGNNASDPTNGGSTGGSTTNTALDLDNAPPENVTWISPGKVNVSNFYPGARAEYPVTIHNGNDYATSFSVSYRYPDNTATGYSKPSDEVQGWVIIADATPVLAPYETRDILVVLAMPEDAEVFAPKFEFWVAVMDMSQSGTVKSEMAVRWLVDMRAS